MGNIHGVFFRDENHNFLGNVLSFFHGEIFLCDLRRLVYRDDAYKIHNLFIS